MAERDVVAPDLLNLARQRAGLSRPDLSKLPLADWENGDLATTSKQRMAFAKATHTPIGYLCSTPPSVERPPIPGLGHARREGVSQAEAHQDSRCVAGRRPRLHLPVPDAPRRGREVPVVECDGVEEILG